MQNMSKYGTLINHHPVGLSCIHLSLLPRFYSFLVFSHELFSYACGGQPSFSLSLSLSPSLLCTAIFSNHASIQALRDELKGVKTTNDMIAVGEIRNRNQESCMPLYQLGKLSRV